MKINLIEFNFSSFHIQKDCPDKVPEKQAFWIVKLRILTREIYIEELKRFNEKNNAV